MTRERALAWPNCRNVRDLGGHVTEDGGTTRFGAVVRADALRRLTDEGWQALADYGIRTVVDLRFRSEIDADPPRDVDVQVVNVPILPDRDDPGWHEIDQISRSAGSHEAAQTAVYLEFLERFHTSFARAIEAVAQAPEGGVVVHCEVGKDRTGLMSALLLRLAGVPLDDIATDYALSRENVRSILDRWIEAATSEADRDLRTRISACPPESMVSVLEELERRHGTVRDYLRASGVSDDDLGRAQARLRQ